jgi:hypothetical protein
MTLAQSPREEVIAEVTKRVDEALRAHRPVYWIMVVALVTILIVGLGLLVYGAISGSWKAVVPGGLFTAMISFPIRKIWEIRESDLRLALIPQLVRLAKTEDAEALTAAFIKQLMREQQGKAVYRSIRPTGGQVRDPRHRNSEPEVLADVLDIFETGGWKMPPD